MEYTKGEWKTYKNALGQWAIATDHEPIAQVDRHYNAHLIAAAPDMYEALVLLYANVRMSGLIDDDNGVMVKAEEALKKAGTEDKQNV